MPRRTGYKQAVRRRNERSALLGAMTCGLFLSAFSLRAAAQIEPEENVPLRSAASSSSEGEQGEAPLEKAPPDDPSPSQTTEPPTADAETGAEDGEAEEVVPGRSEPPEQEQSEPPAGGGGNEASGLTGGESEAAEATPDLTGTPPKPPRENAAPPQGEWDDDYDGRPEATRAEDVLIWIPRAPLYPVHLVLDYGVRKPIVGGVTLAEKHKFFRRVEDWLTFADGKAGIYPVALYDAGRGVWGGLNFFYNDLGREGHSLRATAGVGSNDWILARIKDRLRIFEGGRGELTFSATFQRDPTLAFAGIGPNTRIEDQRFFREEKIEGAVGLRVALPHLNRFSMHLDFKRAKLGPGRSPSLLEEESPHESEGMTGFDRHFEVGRFGMKLDLDSRAPRDLLVPGSGVLLSTWGAYSYGPGETRLSFLRYGGQPKVVWDISGANHVLSLGVYAEAISRTGGEDLPINELIALGGNEQLRGFLPGRFRGESALVYGLDYSWPILAFADALLFGEVGNAYGGFFEDFAHETMVLNWGSGLRSSFSRELSLWFAVGFGTNQFDQWGPDKFRVDKTRFFVGASQRL